MVPSPLVQQHLDIGLDDTECRYDIGGAHPSHAPNGGRLIALGKIDHDNHPGLTNMDVRWASNNNLSVGLLPRRYTVVTGIVSSHSHVFLNRLLTFVGDINADLRRLPSGALGGQEHEQHRHPGVRTSI